MRFAPTNKEIPSTWNRAFWNHRAYEIKSTDLSEIPVGTYFHLDGASRSRNGWRSPWVLWNGRELVFIPEEQVPKTIRTWVLID